MPQELAPISSALNPIQQAEALRTKLNAIQTNQGKEPVPAKDLDAFLADFPEVKEDLIALDFNESNPTTLVLLTVLDDFLSNRSIPVRKPSDGPSPAYMTQEQAVAAGFVVAKELEGQTKHEPAPGFEWADTREDSTNYAVVPEGSIYEEEATEPVLVTGSDNVDLSEVEKLAIDLEDMGYTDAIWEEFLTNVAANGLPDRSFYEAWDASDDKLQAAKIQTLAFGRGLNEFVKQVDSSGSFYKDQVKWLTMAAPRYMKWYRVQEENQQREIESGFSTDDTGRTVSIVEAPEKPPVRVALKGPPEADIVPEAVPEATPEAPVDYRADAREHPEKYLTEAEGDTSIFTPPNDKANRDIRIEDLYEKSPTKPNLTSSRYPGVEFAYQDGSWYDVAGSGRRLAILSGDRFSEVEKEQAPAAPAVAEVSESAPTPAVAEVAAPTETAPDAATLKIKANEAAEIYAAYTALVARDAELARQEATALAARNAVVEEKRDFLETRRSQAKDVTEAENTYAAARAALEPQKKALAADYKNLMPALASIDPTLFEGREEYADALAYARVLVPYKDSTAERIAQLDPSLVKPADAVPTEETDSAITDTNDVEAPAEGSDSEA